jgi:hypothetical protein
MFCLSDDGEALAGGCRAGNANCGADQLAVVDAWLWTNDLRPTSASIT